MSAIKEFGKDSRKVRKKCKWFGIIGVILMAVGGVIMALLPMLVDTSLNNELQIRREGNRVTESWLNMSLPFTVKFYIFNIENPREFIRGAKPRLREMGPYIYVKKMWKRVVGWSRNQETVKYYNYQSFEFDPDRSVGDRNDRVTIVNVPAYGMAAVVRGMVRRLPLNFAIAPIIFSAVNILFSSHDEALITRVTVQELLEGYPFSVLETIDTLTKPLSWFGLKLPDMGMPNNKFGILYQKNNTKDGPYEMYTGQSDPSKFGKIVRYKNKRALNLYNDRKCNMINGTDGLSMGRHMKPEDVPYIFHGEACRSMHLTYKERVMVKGIPAMRYTLSESLFAGPHKNRANRCYCTTPGDYSKCDGIFDISPCKKGAPIAVSLPHLMGAGRKIQSGVIGLKPDPKKHESFVDVQQTMGTPIRASMKLQINLLMKSNPYLSGFRGFRETVLPLLWFEEGGGIDGEMATMLRVATYSIMAADWGSLLLVAIGLALVGFAAFYAIRQRRHLMPSKPAKVELDNVIDIKKETEANKLYPNLSLVSPDFNRWKDPDIYSILKEPYKQKSATAQTPGSDIGGNWSAPSWHKPRTACSPPGALD